MARYVAKNIVAAGLAKRCTVQLAYAIGVVAPVSVFIETHGTGVVDDAMLEAVARAKFRSNTLERHRGHRWNFGDPSIEAQRLTVTSDASYPNLPGNALIEPTHYAMPWEKYAMNRRKFARIAVELN
jgi:S-adenosylmethionine synthetase